MSLIDFYIDPSSICVFSKSTCGYCQKAKKILAQYKVNIQIFELNQITNGLDLSQDLMNRTNQNTVPNIFIFGKHIGGYTELNNLHKNGELSKLINNNKSELYECSFCGNQSFTKEKTCNCFPNQFNDWGEPL